MKKTALLAIAFLILAGAVGGFAYFEYVMKPAAIKKSLAGRTQPAASVIAESATSQSWRAAVPAIGTIQAIQGIDVAPEVAGVIQTLGFKSGQEIELGAMLIELDDGTEQASLKSAQAQLLNSRTSLKRQRELLDRGNTSRSNYDSAIAKRDSDAAEVERIEALIAEKRCWRHSAANSAFVRWMSVSMSRPERSW